MATTGSVVEGLTILPGEYCARSFSGECFGCAVDTYNNLRCPYCDVHLVIEESSRHNGDAGLIISVSHRDSKRTITITGTQLKQSQVERAVGDVFSLHGWRRGNGNYGDRGQAVPFF